MLNINKIQQDPIKHLPEFFLNSKRTSIATKTIKDELILLKDYSINKTTYYELSKKYNYSIKMIYRIIKRWGKSYPPNLSKVKKYNRRLSILDDLKICKFYLDGNSIYKTSKKFKMTPKGVEAVLKRYGFKLRTCLESSYLPHNKRQITYPLSDYVPNLIKKGYKKYFPDFISILTLTDGCCTPPGKLALIVRRPRLVYYGAQTLCKIYIDLVKFYYGINPSVFNKRKDGTYQVIYERKDIKNKLLPDLLSYSPSFKTSPAKGQDKLGYLNTEQPTIIFLKNKPKDILNEVMRLAMSAEGSCNIHINGKRIDSSLRFACSHPGLILEWKTLTDELGFSFKIVYNKEHWSGIDGLCSMKISDLKKFLDINGFVESVKITNNSRYYAGLDKNLIVKGILKWNNKNMRLNDYKTRKEVHCLFRKFIKGETFN